MRNSRLMVQGVAVLTLGMLATGCASIKDHRGYILDEALVATVQPGVDNKVSVERTLGRPTFVSQATASSSGTAPPSSASGAAAPRSSPATARCRWATP
jgi:hypothetical protein